MGNCQASDAAKVVIQQADGRVQRLYWSTSAGEIMRSNPDHYVAILAVLPPAPGQPPGHSFENPQTEGHFDRRPSLPHGHPTRGEESVAGQEAGRMRKAQAEMMKRQHKQRLQRVKGGGGGVLINGILLCRASLSWKLMAPSSDG
ncbi:hypothetical protein HPP92_010335 [Vanilla planifolia]|uniref:Uncharacterized protein n=1 Tax=Vanilla planifolia TaxID=51239 RepID=A0A835R3W4_VANPL|nr:hypothetical protein HPP92_010335 [Vanilla planifolia]